MDWRDLPPLSALRAFSAFVETGNLVKAGTALGVSHGAISQQLRGLEEHLDVALLDRSGRALRLTPEGEKLGEALHAGFGGMIEAVQEITGVQDARPLHISTTPTFAASWLMPRLPQFRAQYPDVDLMLNPTPEVVALSSDGIDVALRYGKGVWQGMEAEMLLCSSMVVIGAPSLVGPGELPDVKALAELPWLEEYGTTEASRWLEEQGIDRGPRRGWMRLPGNLLLDAARDGQGVAVVVRAFAEGDIAAGRLVALMEQEPGSAGYYIVTRPGVQRPALRNFIKWLRREGKAALRGC